MYNLSNNQTTSKQHFGVGHFLTKPLRRFLLAPALETASISPQSLQVYEKSSAKI